MSGPERGDFLNKEQDVDIEGNPRQKWILEPKNEVFFGSEKEMLKRKAEIVEEVNDR